ncbi:MAG: hypothetical protein IKO73_06770 [Bacteroidaceae bacterium]|nr:hypothetical protein [Bacteroidaceae bacterium]
METIGENLFQVKKERTYISCLVKGCTYGFKHLGMLLHYMWPSLVLSVLFPIPFIFFYAAQLDAILRKWIELGYIPNVTLKVMRRDIEHCASRSGITILISLLLLPIALAGVALLILPMVMGLKYWWGVLAFFIIFILMLPMVVVVMQIGYSDTPLKECFRSGLKLAYKNLGKIFAFEFLSALFGLIIGFLGGIPFQIVFAAGLQAYKGWQMGDVLDLPALFPLYATLAVLILNAVILIAAIVFSFSRCLMWGSLVEEVPTEAEANS